MAIQRQARAPSLEFLGLKDQHLVLIHVQLTRLMPKSNFNIANMNQIADFHRSLIIHNYWSFYSIMLAPNPRFAHAQTTHPKNINTCHLRMNENSGYAQRFWLSACRVLGFQGFEIPDDSGFYVLLFWKVNNSLALQRDLNMSKDFQTVHLAAKDRKPSQASKSWIGAVDGDNLAFLHPGKDGVNAKLASKMFTKKKSFDPRQKEIFHMGFKYCHNCHCHQLVARWAKKRAMFRVNIAHGTSARDKPASFACKAQRNAAEDPGCCKISLRLCATAWSAEPEGSYYSIVWRKVG